MTSKSASRQQKYRTNLANNGLAQVRLTVPECNAEELKAIAAAMRYGGASEPPTPKQQYRLKQAAKNGCHQPLSRIAGEKWLLEMWLLMKGY